MKQERKQSWNLKASEKMADYLERELEKVRKTQKYVSKYAKHADLIQQCFPEGHWFVNVLGDMVFELPLRFALIAEVKEFMAMHYPQMEIYRDILYVWDEDGKAGHFLEYHIDQEGYEFTFRSEKKGSTCVLNPIGEKTVPIFEVVCSEDAAAEFTLRAKSDG